MARFAWTAISSFSALPLKASLFGGLTLSVIGVLYAFYVLYETFVLKTTVRGWSSLVCLQILFSGATLTALGLVGDYIARIYEEAKGRPLYVLAESRNVSHTLRSPRRGVRLDARRTGAGRSIEADGEACHAGVYIDGN
jgi:dolichol-phosphate mannosyltransferase